jgi:uncharacterized protein
MQFTQITGGDLNLITGYAPDHVAVNGIRHFESLILRPDGILASWPVRGVEGLSLEALEWIRRDPPEILLLGTGEQQSFPERSLWKRLRAEAWGIEIMDTAAACRTYNLIMAEGRAVAAALIIGSGSGKQDVL